MDEVHVIRATREWIENAVIGLNLCPFARSPYLNEQVRFVVSHATHADAFLEQLDEELTYLAEVPAATVETTLLIHPTLFPDFETFDDITAIAEEAVVEHGLEGVIQVASFHPRFQFADTEADDISNYTNRSPFPTLHLLREASISAALDAYPAPEEIYQRNIETMKMLGHTGWDKLHRIREDDTQA